MSRELKFKAYDPETGQMTGGATLKYACEQAYEKGNRQADFEWDDNIVMLQYTGLKDKNGTEIYEGDIVKCIDHPTGLENTIGEVHFEDGCFCVRYSMITLGGFREEWREVIGNIYQNAELLTKTQIQ